MSARKSPEDTESEILERVVQPHKATLPPEAARSILALGFKATDIKRMNALAIKAQAGTLRPAEEAALNSYLRVGRFLALVQAKARRSLKIPTVCYK